MERVVKVSSTDDPSGPSPEDLKHLEETILNWLHTRPPGWRWVFSGRMFTQEETIQRFKKDREFHRRILEAAILKSINDFKK